MRIIFLNFKGMALETQENEAWKSCQTSYKGKYLVKKNVNFLKKVKLSRLFLESKRSLVNLREMMKGLMV